MFLTPQNVFTGIGRLPYFPQYVLEQNRVKNLPETYRIGIYKNYPQSREKEIRIVKHTN